MPGGAGLQESGRPLLSAPAAGRDWGHTRSVPRAPEHPPAAPELSSQPWCTWHFDVCHYVNCFTPTEDQGARGPGAVFVRPGPVQGVGSTENGVTNLLKMFTKITQVTQVLHRIGENKDM